MLLSVGAIGQAAEISYGFSLNLRLVNLIQVNYCFYKELVLSLFSVGCWYYETSGWLLVVAKYLRIHGLGSAKAEC